MTPAAQVRLLIRTNIDKFPQLKKEHVYAFMIGPEEKTKTDPILVISELPRKGHIYGNNIPIEERRRIQITFYYPRDYEDDMEGLEEQIESFLVTKGFYNYSNAGHAMTPDNGQITNTLKFNYIKEINNKWLQ